MSFLSIVSSVLSLLRWLASFIEGERNKQAGRNEVTAQVNKETADAERRMAEVNDNPSDGIVVDRMRDGSFFAGQDNMSGASAVRPEDAESSRVRVQTTGGWVGD